MPSLALLATLLPALLAEPCFEETPLTNDPPRFFPALLAPLVPPPLESAFVAELLTLFAALLALLDAEDTPLANDCPSLLPALFALEELFPNAVAAADAA